MGLVPFESLRRGLFHDTNRAKIRNLATRAIQRHQSRHKFRGTLKWGRALKHRLRVNCALSCMIPVGVVRSDGELHGHKRHCIPHGQSTQASVNFSQQRTMQLAPYTSAVCERGARTRSSLDKRAFQRNTSLVELRGIKQRVLISPFAFVPCWERAASPIAEVG